ncbi:MAG: orotidine-5'-phosphate decarboxylase [Schleiferiaceae bacterium]
MTREELVAQIKEKKTALCIGLDTDIDKIPTHLLSEEDPLFAFNKAIIDATADHCVAYKPNIAFYEAHGVSGWESLKKTIDYLNENYPNHFTIADAKRGDIGNTSKMYAKAFLETLNFDSITVAPYMGEDSVSPFVREKGKWVILLALTSNKGSQDFQRLTLDSGEEMYTSVLSKSQEWVEDDQLMYVVGATHPESMKALRARVPHHFFLVPGVGAQGGTVEDVMKNGMNEDVGLLINSSRGIIYASNGEDFAEVAKGEAQKLSKQMADFI